MRRNNKTKTRRDGRASVSATRRRLLLGLGAVGGALALKVGTGKAMAGNLHKAQEGTLPGMLSSDERLEHQPCFGRHQAGILTPQQAAMMLVAFDVLAENQQDLERLFRLLTERIAFLTTGGQYPIINERLPPIDSGILGTFIYPDNLTITVSVGHSLFDQRLGLSEKKPQRLQMMHRFPNDSLDGALCHGDLLLQICANNSDTVIHALRDIIKHTPDLLTIRWKREGFISSHAARSKGRETPINLFGFKDGTANPSSLDSSLMDKVVWVGKQAGEPLWTYGGSYQAVRIIRFHVEFWDRTPLKEQQQIFGRNKSTGAPLGMQKEHDIPDFQLDPQGLIIPLGSHMRLANPRRPEDISSTMLRRGYSYSLGISNSGQLDMGLLFVSYQHDLEKGFITVQRRLNGEALEEYIQPVGGGYFFVLPGVPDKTHYLGQGLLEI